MITSCKVGIEGARFFSYHGYYEAERKYGHYFVIDCMINLDVVPDAESSLDSTINYQDIYSACLAEMNQPQLLLETVLANIINRLYSFSNVKSGYIKIKKEGAQLGGVVGGAVVEMTF